MGKFHNSGDKLERNPQYSGSHSSSRMGSFRAAEFNFPTKGESDRWVETFLDLGNGERDRWVETFPHHRKVNATPRIDAEPSGNRIPDAAFFSFVGKFCVVRDTFRVCGKVSF